ncbi:MAG: ribbon-helix-helix domain-containing protein [Nanoarchaeota archaeon]|nr:ribbon-helix-helix domain-containing protein [Nanoarchaeota archaeon]
MVMDTLQIRLSHGLVERIDALVDEGLYPNRSDAIRDAVRRFVWATEAGSISKKGNAVELVRKARQKLSKEKTDLNKINRL